MGIILFVVLLIVLLVATIVLAILFASATLGEMSAVVVVLGILSGIGLVGGFWLFTAYLVALTGIDIDRQLLPDVLTVPLVWIGLAASVMLGAGEAPPPAALPDAVIGAIAGYGFLWLVFHLFRLLTGKEGMGYGDFKLFAAIGAWLGWQMLPLTILLSSLVGAVVGVVLIVLGRHGRNVPIPFGPYLAAAGVIALFWGEAITARYLGML